ncbi:hypothetical protein [Dialister invisus]|uniref:hypothetical protein n=1 Tax=Dialister invisus TaxID=218538 RepID=UPI00267387DA|nr:hypothetical protein [Dialister invisus]
MFTLRDTLLQRGYKYESYLGERAQDICFQTVNDLCYALGYILSHIQRIDAEIPQEQVSEIIRVIPNYPITTNYTSGGNDMKWGKQYRIYFNSIINMPIELERRLQNDDKMRITGSRFIEACFFIGFVPGTNQNKDLIFKRMEKIFNDKEIKYFNNGYKG